MASALAPRHPAEASRLRRFASVGVLGVGVNTGLLWFLTDRLHLYYVVASVVATECAILHNFAWNHAWTFGDRPRSAPVLPRLARFNVVALGGLALTVGVLFALTALFGVHYLLANLAAVVAGAGWNYAASRRWVWPNMRPAWRRRGETGAHA